YCAHHVRIWNKRFLTNVLLPYNTARPFLGKTAARQLRTNKVFAVLCCLKYISDLISPGSHIREHLIELINGGGRLLNMKDMGFPPDWRTLDVWKERK
ncbi:MAG: Abi family protein, partial [Prevotellaceae bacterium]|nr:Abi family protein [Prevotellaceae bacterium]